MSLAAALEGVTDDDAIVKALQRRILANGNEEATAYLKALPPDRADALRWKLVASLESIGQRKQRSKKKRSAATAAKQAPAPAAPTASVPRAQPAAKAAPARAPAAVAEPAPATAASTEDGAEASPAKRKTRGKLLAERFQMGELIGKGGFARVYKALDLTTGEQVAVKEIEKDLVSKTELPKILAEGEVLNRLNHNNIVRFVELVQDKKQIYFVMEYISGGSLYHTMKKFGVFPEPLVCCYIAQALLALEYLHAQGVLHRDIKGANLLVNSNGQIKLADFGACTYAQLDRRLTVIGTPFWMAPEIIEMTSGGTAADLWSLGCTVIELLTGSPPYYTLGAMQALFRMVDDDHPPLPSGLSPACQSFLLACFVKDFAKRPTATQLLAHEWIKKGIAGRENPAISPEQMQMTLRQHNLSKKTSVAGIDWGKGTVVVSDTETADQNMLHKQAQQLKHEDGESLKEKLARKEKERAAVARALSDAKATLAALKRDIVALTAEKSTLELQAAK